MSHGQDNSVFEDFIESTQQRSSGSVAAPRAIERVTVLGGGLDARLLATLCQAQGASVQVFSAYAAELEALAKGIAIDGDGPIGRYPVAFESSQQQHVIGATSSIDACLAEAELVFLTGPIHKQRTYAMVLADHLHDGQILVLPNARTFAACEAAWLLKVGGCTADVSIVDMHGLPFWFSSTGVGLSLQAAAPVSIACLPTSRSQAVLGALSNLLPGLQSSTNPLQSALQDCSALTELPALLLGGCALPPGGPAIPMGGTALPENQSFYNLLGSGQKQIAATLLEERAQVARRYGVREMPTLEQAMQTCVGEASGSGRRAVPDKACATALIRDGVIGSLVPLRDAARLAGVDVPLTQSLIHLSCAVLGNDVSISGRQLHSIGIQTDSFEQAYAGLLGLCQTLRAS